MKWRQGLKHPLGGGLLATSAALAVVSGLDLRWDGQEALLLIWGAMIYASVTAYVALRGQGRPAAEVAPLPRAGTAAEIGPEDLVPMVEQALRNLKNPGVLAANGMIARLPLTLEAAHVNTGRTTEPTPLEKAQLLRSVIEVSMERLRPSRQYDILVEHYLQDHPVAYSEAAHYRAESTLFRDRKKGIRAIAVDLAAQETNLARRR